MEVINEYSGTSRGAADERQQVERLKKLLLAMASDVRVVLIKLADRLHNMRTLRHMDPEARQRIASETLEIYAPLASRLGMAQFKWEMEDLALRELEPQTYASIARQLDGRRTDREHYVQQVVSTLAGQLTEQGIKADVRGRAKHIYSIWKKMQQKNLTFDQVYDNRATRILVEDVAACYSVLGMVHTMWKHIAKEFDDYIANPKSNRYQSLHTAVIGPQGKTLEVQIRTHEMHVHAEYGVAAHWRYKEGTRAPENEADAKVEWLKQILDVNDDAEGPRDFLDRFNSELLNDRVYAVTPQGQVLDLPAGATPLDFAYQVHTDVGHRCRGAKVNGTMVALTTKLNSGDQVEILYLGYLTTPRARARVRHWFKHRDQEKNLASGQEIYQRELRKLGVANPQRELLLQRFNYKRFEFEDLLIGIGCGDVSSVQIANALQQFVPAQAPAPARVPLRKQPHRPEAGVQIEGVGNLLTQMAKCCLPVPGDDIIGYITRGRGVTIHRADCPNMLRFDAERRARVVNVSWTERDTETYTVNILISAYDRHGLLRDVTIALTSEGINIGALHTQNVERDHTVQIRISLQVADLQQLSRILDRVTQLPNVFEAQRVA
jgi:GTP pyrophosphokinase